MSDTSASAETAKPDAVQSDSAKAEDGSTEASSEFKSEESKKALLAELYAARDARKALQKQLDDIAAANLSDLEKAQKAATEAQEVAAKATTEALRYRIAAETEITENIDLILTAPDEETMRKQAEVHKAARTSTGNTPGPRPDLSQGSKGSPTTADPAADFANFLGAQLSGRG